MKSCKAKKCGRRRKGPTEAKIVSDVHRRLKARGIPSKIEVPLLGRSIDLVYVSESSLISIEFKLNDWRRAVAQARDHRLGADFSYICLPKRKITEKLRQFIIDAEVGLFFYLDNGAWPMEKVIEAPKSNETWSIAKAKLVSLVSP